jgi:hypothetical protein
VGIRSANHVTPLYPQKLTLTSPTAGGLSVGMVRSRTKATEFSLVYWGHVVVHCATRRKVVGSIPDCVSGIFIDIILPVALWL